MHKTIGRIGLQRQQEIIIGVHAMTVPPLYTIYEEVITICEFETGYNQSTTLFEEGKEQYRRYSADGAWIEGDLDEDGYNSIELEGTKYGPLVRCFFHDKFVTVCFTRDAAELFIKNERHNLSNPRIWVHAIPRRNIELNEIGHLFGDKENW